MDSQETGRESPQTKRGRTTLETDKILEKAGYLLITAGQDSKSTARLTADAADDQRYIGGGGWLCLLPGYVFGRSEGSHCNIYQLNGWAPATNAPPRPEDTHFPNVPACGSWKLATFRIPNVKDRIRSMPGPGQLLGTHAKEMEVPQFRDGECEVRRPLGQGGRRSHGLGR